MICPLVTGDGYTGLRDIQYILTISCHIDCIRQVLYRFAGSEIRAYCGSGSQKIYQQRQRHGFCVILSHEKEEYGEADVEDSVNYRKCYVII